jgi:hypothetical protein
MDESVIINKEFRGPPEYGQGGYVCGVVAQLIGDAAEVTLRGPAPLEKSLKVQRLDEGGVVISDGYSMDSTRSARWPRWNSAVQVPMGSVRLPPRLGPICLY